MRSFGAVDSKLYEADFFCSELGKVGSNIYRGQYLFSAFVASGRSVTFSIQASISDVDGFAEWYSGIQSNLKKDKLARFFHDCRTDSQHIGLNPLIGGAGYKDSQRLYFGQPEPHRYKYIPDIDVHAACVSYMQILCQVVNDCYGRFALIIDPNAIYTISGLSQLNLSIEDVEEELGFPRGYTDILWPEEGKDEERLKLLRRQIAMPTVEELFIKYAELDVFVEDRRKEYQTAFDLARRIDEMHV